jgi:Mg2+/Co2+ transporter CorC
VDLDDFNEVMGTEITKETADTLGGLMYGEIGRVPSGGERVTVEDIELTVDQVLGRRIRKVRARALQEVEQTQEENKDVDTTPQG